MDKDSLVQKIMTITEAMLKEARLNNWTDIAKMETDRKVYLNDYFQEAVDNAHAEQAANLVQDVLEADKKLIDLVNEVKNKFSQEHSTLKEGHKATQAYQVNQK